MSRTKVISRITLEHAFVLHRYNWSESSLIVEVLTRHYGRVTLVAKGAKKPASNLRPVLLPMQPLRLTYTGDGDIKNLKSAEWQGGYAMPSGAALLSGFYINELVLRLLPRDAPHEAIFDYYAQTIAVIAQNNDWAAAALRSFELLLLQDMGWLPNLAVVTQTQQSLQGETLYHLHNEEGIKPVGIQGAWGLAGWQWQALHHVLAHKQFGVLLTHLQETPATTQALKGMLRQLVTYHCGRALNTPQTMQTLQQL